MDWSDFKDNHETAIIIASASQNNDYFKSYHDFAILCEEYYQILVGLKLKLEKFAIVVTKNLPKNHHSLAIIFSLWKLGIAWLPVISAPEEEKDYSDKVYDDNDRMSHETYPIMTIVSNKVENGIALGPFYHYMGTYDKLDLSPENNTLYGMRTSGTSGRARKTVWVPRNSILTNIEGIRERLETIGSEKSHHLPRLISLAPMTFDPFIVEILVTLCSRGTLVFLEREEDKLNVNVISEISHRLGINLWMMTPSLFQSMTMTLAIKDCPFTSDSVIILGGEAFPRKNVDKLISQKPSITVFNIYGTTECSCWATMYKYLGSESHPVPIGPPLKDTILALEIDGGNKLLPSKSWIVGMEGILWIGGPKRYTFVKDSEAFGMCDGQGYLRSTGDLVKVIEATAGKDLVVTGRIDFQRKRHGVRISLETLEAIFPNSYAIMVDESGLLELYLYSNDHDHITDSQVMQKILKEGLTEAYLPDVIYRIPKPPEMNQNGKITRKRWHSPKLPSKSINNTKSYVLTLASALIPFNDNDSISLSPEDYWSECGGKSLAAMTFVRKICCDFNLDRDSHQNELLMMLLHQPLSSIILYLEGKDEDNANYFTLDDRPNHKKAKLFRSIKPCDSFYMEKCVDADATVFGHEPNKLLIVGSHSGLLVCLKIIASDVNKSPSFELVWKTRLGGRIESKGCVDTLEKARFYCQGCHDGTIYIVRVGCGTLHKMVSTGSLVKATPVYQKDRFWVGSHDGFCYGIPLNDPKEIENPLPLDCNKEAIVAAIQFFPTSFISVATLRGNVHFFSQETFKRVKTVHVGVAIFSEMKRTILQRPFLLLVASVDGWVTAIDEAFTKIWTVSLKGPIFTSLTMTSDESYLLVIEQNKSISAIDIIDPIHGVKSFRTPKSELIQGIPSKESKLNDSASDFRCQKWLTIDLDRSESSFTGLLDVSDGKGVFVFGTRNGDRLLMIDTRVM